MTALQNFDEYVTRALNGYWARRNFCGQVDSNTTATLFAGQRLSLQLGALYTIEAMQPGVSGYRLTAGTLYSSTQTPFLIGKIVYLGAYNLGTGLFDTGGPMPTVTEGNISRQAYSSVIMYAANNLTLTSGTSLNISVQYVDQDNNTAESAPSVTLTNPVTQNTAAFLRLNGTDIGVLDITGCSTTGTGVYTGIIAFLGFIPFGIFNPTLQIAASAMQLNLLTDTFSLPLLSANDQIGFINFSNAAKRYQGTLSFIGEQA